MLKFNCLLCSCSLELLQFDIQLRIQFHHYYRHHNSQESRLSHPRKLECSLILGQHSYCSQKRNVFLKHIQCYIPDRHSTHHRSSHQFLGPHRRKWQAFVFERRYLGIQGRRHNTQTPALFQNSPQGIHSKADRHHSFRSAIVFHLHKCHKFLSLRGAVWSIFGHFGKFLTIIRGLKGSHD